VCKKILLGIYEDGEHKADMSLTRFALTLNFCTLKLLMGRTTSLAIDRDWEGRGC